MFHVRKMNPIVHFLLFQSLHITTSPFTVPETVKKGFLDRNHLDLLCIHSEIHTFYGYKHWSWRFLERAEWKGRGKLGN